MNAQTIETVFDDPIEIALAERALELAKARLRWNTIRDFYRPIVNALQRLGLEPRLSNEVDVSFTGDAHMLASVVRVLRTAGMNTTAERPKAGETSWSAYYSHPECKTQLWLYFTSSVCRRVKVGTRTVVEDIYEVRCGDDDQAIEDAVPAIEAASAPQFEEIPF